jgi:hypothetical protein
VAGSFTADNLIAAKQGSFSTIYVDAVVLKILSAEWFAVQDWNAMVREMPILNWSDYSSGEGQIMATRSGLQTASDGVAVVSLKQIFGEVWFTAVNTDFSPSARGGYTVDVFALDGNGAYLDEASMTPTEFTVRSSTGKAAKFRVRVYAVKKGMEAGRLSLYVGPP